MAASGSAGPASSRSSSDRGGHPPMPGLVDRSLTSLQQYELLSKLLVSPLIILIVVPYIIPYITPL